MRSMNIRWLAGATSCVKHGIGPVPAATHGLHTTMFDTADRSRRLHAERTPATRLAALMAVLLPAAVWSAGPREEVNAAIDKLLTARSYQASMVSADGRLQQQLEFEAPGRYRIRNHGEELVIVGDVLHRERDGAIEQVPLPQDVLTRWRDPARLAEQPADMDVVVLDDETVAGVPARKYRIHRAQSAPGLLLLWVRSDGYPVQILTRSVTGAAATLIRYSRFNDPAIDIEPPP